MESTFRLYEATSGDRASILARNCEILFETIFLKAVILIR